MQLITSRKTFLFKQRSHLLWNQQTGSILIIVMAVCLVLVVLTLYIGQSLILNYRAAENVVASIQAEQAIEGLIRYLTNYLATYISPGEFPSSDELNLEALQIGEATCWVIGRDPSGDSTTLYFGLIDEASKININTATREILVGLPNMTDELADSIIDWRDEDEQPLESGAESQTYSFGKDGYIAKNGPFDFVEELLLVNGCSWELLYGEDWNRNGVLDFNENDGNATFPPDDGDGVLESGLIEYLTVWTREPNQRSDGSSRININSDREGLRQLLSETFGDGRAQEIMNRISGQSNFRSILEFYIRSGMSLDEFRQIEDAITVSSDQFIQGLINVVTAPAPVFAALLGGDESLAAQIVAYRARLSSEARKTVAWIADAIDEDSAIRIGPYLTHKSYQFGIDICAIGRNQRGYRRVFFIVDMADGGPKIVYKKDLTGLGWALGESVKLNSFIHNVRGEL